MWGDINHSSNETIAKSDAALVLPPDLPKTEEKSVIEKTPTEGTTAQFIHEPVTFKTETLSSDEKIVDMAPAIEKVSAMIEAVENRIKKLMAEQDSIKNEMNNLNEKEAGIINKLSVSQNILDGLKSNLDQLQAMSQFIEAGPDQN